MGSRSPYLSYDGGAWEGGPSDVEFVNVRVDGRANNLLTEDILLDLLDKLNDAHFTPVISQFRVNGPIEQPIECFNKKAGTGIFYTDPELLSRATELAEIVKISTIYKNLPINYVNPNALSEDDPFRFFFERSRVRLQICLNDF